MSYAEYEVTTTTKRGRVKLDFGEKSASLKDIHRMNMKMQALADQIAHLKVSGPAPPPSKAVVPADLESRLSAIEKAIERIDHAITPVQVPVKDFESKLDTFGSIIGKGLAHSATALNEYFRGFAKEVRALCEGSRKKLYAALDEPFIPIDHDGLSNRGKRAMTDFELSRKEQRALTKAKNPKMSMLNEMLKKKLPDEKLKELESTLKDDMARLRKLLLKVEHSVYLGAAMEKAWKDPAKEFFQDMIGFCSKAQGSFEQQKAEMERLGVERKAEPGPRVQEPDSGDEDEEYVPSRPTTPVAQQWFLESSSSSSCSSSLLLSISPSKMVSRTSTPIPQWPAVEAEGKDLSIAFPPFYDGVSDSMM